MPPHRTPVAAFVALHRELLELERGAEIEEARRLWDELPAEELERRGVTLRRMAVTDRLVTFGGRVSVVLEPSRGGAMPAHRMAVGDVVALRVPAERGGSDSRSDASGVVAKVTDAALTVTLDDDDAEVPDLVHVDRVAPDVTFRRMIAALDELAALRAGPAQALRAVAFGERAPEFAAGPDESEIRFLDPKLDHSQRAAVAHALRARDVALIHGPPGTGKTTALVEVIRQAVRRGMRVLAVAPSNVAVDNLVERLARPDVEVVRVGHPARLLPQVVEHCLDALVDVRGDRALLKRLRREIEKLQRRLDRGVPGDERHALRTAIRDLRREVRQIEAAAVRAVLDTADVVLATTTGAASSVLRGREFELVVVDEAAQALEAAAWIALLRGRRAVLAGDHRQLPPTILSQEAARRGLATTLFERLDRAFGASATRMLTVQYRMHEVIMRWASNALYEGRLEAHASVAAHRLCDLPHVLTNDDTTCPMLLIDTAGCGFDESESLHDRSKWNVGEAQVVAAHVRALLDAGVRGGEIAVITPYNAQVEVLRRRLDDVPALEIGTVDGFQGREKEAVVLSMVRSNESGEVGFLAEKRRLNVAVTRARRHVAVVGDSATLAHDAFLRALLDHCAAEGVHRSAWGMV